MSESTINELLQRCGISQPRKSGNDHELVAACGETLGWYDARGAVELLDQIAAACAFGARHGELPKAGTRTVSCSDAVDTEKLAREYGYTVEPSRTRTLCWNFINSGERHRKNFRTEQEAWDAACKHGKLEGGFVTITAQALTALRPARTPGQIAYESDCAIEPRYSDGSIRRTWDQLPGLVRDTWERNPTVRAKVPS